MPQPPIPNEGRRAEAAGGRRDRHPELAALFGLATKSASVGVLDYDVMADQSFWSPEVCVTERKARETHEKLS